MYLMVAGSMTATAALLYYPATDFSGHLVALLAHT